MLPKSALALFCVLEFGARHICSAAVIVTTTYGPVRGIEAATASGHSYYRYLGIRYAQPPVGPLRYESPRAPIPWSFVLDATSFGNDCPQLDFLFGLRLGREDCLFLNVYTPKSSRSSRQGRRRQNSKHELLPVMFFIYGGLFIGGSAKLLGPDSFMEDDVVLVTINYRVGSLGFLNTGDGRVRGNMGLKDQSMALQWVHDNIAQFGGDPKRVTIFGHSAGAASVHYHLLSDRSRNLFQKAISQSGTSLARWALRTEPKRQAKRYASQLGCSGGAEGSGVDVDCLKRVPLREILTAHSEIKTFVNDPIVLFGPTIEVVNDSQMFLSRHPADIVRAGEQQRKPWILGFMSHEGQMTSTMLVNDPSLWKKYDEDWETSLAVTRTFWTDKAKMHAVKDFYFGEGQKLDESKLENFTNLVTDFYFAHNSQQALDLQSKLSPTYPYFYTYRGHIGIVNAFKAVKQRLPRLVEAFAFGVRSVARMWERSPWYSKESYEPCHGDDVMLWAPNPLMRPGHPDYEFSRELARLWIQFASQNEGNDTGGLKLGSGETWRPWSQTYRKYLRLDQEFEVIDPPFQERFKFLDLLNKV